MPFNIQILQIIHTAFDAGQEIVSIYFSENVTVKFKQDTSPLTIADTKAHQLIHAQLTRYSPHIPIISEEGILPDYHERKQWPLLWLVDPLDGTKEFLHRNGEFTVNIGLIENGIPVLGVIYCPYLDIMYFASKEIGSYKMDNCKQILSNIKDEKMLFAHAQKLPLTTRETPFTIAVSRSHCSQETEDFIQKLREQHEQIRLITSGSSIKMCLVAEGTVDLYPRLSDSMEWDTAAGEAIVRYSGGSILNSFTNEPLQYNKESVRNPYHIVRGRKR